MSLILDHLAVSGESRDAARAHIEAALGLPMQQGGTHDHFGTHNHLMGLENGLYLEAISKDPGAPDPAHARWFDLDNFTGPPRLTNWIVTGPDLDSYLANNPGLGAPMQVTRGPLRWRMAVPYSGRLPFDNMHPALIAWEGTAHPAQMLTPTGATLTALTIRHPHADLLQTRLGPVTKTDVRFETGPAEIIAEFDTPHGPRTLT